jgi:hypothetical protein
MTINSQEQIEGERPVVDVIVGHVMDYQERHCKPGTTRSKVYGTFKDARLRILDGGAGVNLGLFSRPGSSFAATVSFSNGVPGDRSDAQPKILKLGIKVHGVPGAKILPGEEDSDCCDFVLANHPGLCMRRPEDYPAVLEERVKGKIFAEVHRRFSAVNRLNIKAMWRQVKNPLTIDYYSGTSYTLGLYPCRPVKYVLVADQRSSFFSLPNFFDRDFLRHAVEKLLGKQSVRFTFCVQFQQEGDPIEDASVVWKGPLIPVAVLEIPRLRDDQPVLESGGEQLFFHPWRTLPEHEPLGWYNRVFKTLWLTHLYRDFLQKAGDERSVKMLRQKCWRNRI